MDGVTKSAARQITAGFFEQDQSAVHALENGTALAHALKMHPQHCTSQRKKRKISANSREAERRSCGLAFKTKGTL